MNPDATYLILIPGRNKVSKAHLGTVEGSTRSRSAPERSARGGSLRLDDMELPTSDIGIFISLILILAVSLIALVADLLNGNMEILREENMRLRAREDGASSFLSLRRPAAPAAALEPTPTPPAAAIPESAPPAAPEITPTAPAPIAEIASRIPGEDTEASRADYPRDRRYLIISPRPGRASAAKDGTSAPESTGEDSRR